MGQIQNPVRPWWVLAIICLPVFIGALDLTIISAVLPEVITSLNLKVKDSLDQASWAVSGYLLAYAISMTFMGRLSDILGRRKVYLVCLLIFTFGSYLVTIYDSELLTSWIARFYRVVLDEKPPALEERHLYLVITGRVVQAFGAGAMVPITLALVGDMFPEGKRANPLGVVGAIDTLGWVLGHLYGGIMVRFFGQNEEAFVDAAAKLGLTIAPPSWETLFILNIPISILAMIGAWWALRGVEQLRRQRVVMPVKPKHGVLSGLRNLRFDFLGAFLIALALLGLNLGLGTGSPETAVTASSFEELPNDYRGTYVAVGAVALVLFILVELWVTHPLIPLKHFRSLNFTSAALTNLLVGFCLAIGLVSGPLLVNFRADTPSNEDIQEAAYIAGWILSGLTVPMMLAAVPGGKLTDRRGYRLPTMLGLALAAIGFILAGISWTEDTSYITMAAQMAMIGVGLGLTISPIGTAALNEAAEDERGTVSALILVLRLIGMTIAISSLTIFSLNRFDAKVDDRIADLRDTRLEQALQQAEADYEASLPFSPWALLIRNYQVYLAQRQADSLSFTSEEISDVNFGAAVEAINEMLFIGAGVSGIAFLIALALRAGRGSSVVQSTAPPEGETKYRDRTASSL